MDRGHCRLPYLFSSSGGGVVGLFNLYECLTFGRCISFKMHGVKLTELARLVPWIVPAHLESDLRLYI